MFANLKLRLKVMPRRFGLALSSREQLHQWNFTFDQGNCIIQGNGQTFNVNRLLSDAAEIVCTLDPPYVSLQMRKQ